MSDIAEIEIINPNDIGAVEIIAADDAVALIEIYNPPSIGGGGSGTVTSVGLSMPTGFTVSGSPVTSSGTLAASFDTGYQAFTSTESSKLAGIEPGATGDQSAAEILAALLTVDGPGSGLNADLLDGNSAAAFALAGHDHSGVYQPLDSDLTTIAGLSSADGNFIVGSASGWVVESGATVRTSLGVDAAGTDNSTNVTLAGSLDYLTLSGQQITLGAIDLAADVTGQLPAASVSGLGGAALLSVGTTAGTVAAGDHNHSGVYQPLDTQLTDLAGLSYSGNTLKVIRVNAGETGFELATISAGGGDALTSGTLDQFADVTQTAGQTLAITASTTLSGGTHSGTNTGDQDLSGYVLTAAIDTLAELNAIITDATLIDTTDSRLSDARTPTSHVHGNLSNAGAIGVTSGLPIKTGTIGVLEAGAFGTSAGQFAEGNDARFHDAITLAGTPDYITLSGQVLTRNQIDLTADVAGDLPFANLAAASAASKLLGRGSASGAGDFQEITLGTGLSMSGTTLSASGGTGGTGTVAIKSSPENITSTSLADITGLTFAMAASKKYAFETFLIWTSDTATNGVRFAMNGSAAATSVFYHGMLDRSGAFVGVTAYATAYDGEISTGTTGSTSPRVAILCGLIENSSSASTLAVRCSTEAGTQTIAAGSYLKIQEVTT